MKKKGGRKTKKMELEDETMKKRPNKEKVNTRFDGHGRKKADA